MKPWKILAGAVLLAGCSVPGLGTVTPPVQPKTAPDSTTISSACRTSLQTLEPDTLNAYDAAVGDPSLDAAEIQNLHDALVWGARQVGVSTCD